MSNYLEYTLYNAIKTPDGTILECQTENDYKMHIDTISKETYINDGLGYSTKRSINIMPFEDLAITTNSPFEIVRTVKFWGSYGKDGKSPKKTLSLEEMEDSHITAILETQTRIKGKSIEQIFIKEQEYRIITFKNDLDKKIPVKNPKETKVKKIKL